MKVKDFIANLQNWEKLRPSNSDAEIMLRYDGDVCKEFGSALDAISAAGQCLILEPAFNGAEFKMKDVRTG